MVLEGAFLRLPGHEARLSAEDAALWERVSTGLGGAARFRPPRVRDFAIDLGIDEREVRRILKLCARMGRVDEIAHDHFFLRATTAEMVALAADVAARSADGWFTAARFRDRMDNGRKVAIQILDFFDRHGVTLRRGDLRRINPHRLDLFGTAARAAREENRPRWGVRTSTPGGAASLSRVGSTPILFRQPPRASRRAADGFHAQQAAASGSPIRSSPRAVGGCQVFDAGTAPAGLVPVCEPPRPPLQPVGGVARRRPVRAGRRRRRRLRHAGGAVLRLLAPAPRRRSARTPRPR